MSRFIALGGTLAVALLLVGAGCAKPVDPDRIDDDVITIPGDTDSPVEDTDSVEVEYKTEGDGVVELHATAIGTRQVKFEWELSKTVEEPAYFILLRGEDAELEHDQKTFWFRQHGTKRVATWVNLPPGEQFFRLCASNDKETCDLYSDALKVEVLSGPTKAPKKTEQVSDSAPKDTFSMPILLEDIQPEDVAEAKMCNASGGTWKWFGNGCADACGVPVGATCTSVMTQGCDCGGDQCWNDSSCGDEPGTTEETSVEADSETEETSTTTEDVMTEEVPTSTEEVPTSTEDVATDVPTTTVDTATTTE